MPNKKIITSLVIFAVLAINLFFGLPRLANYSSVDEPYWTYDRTTDFWKAIAQHKWKNTNINDKPGITVATISGLGLPWADPTQYKSVRQEPKSLATAQGIIAVNFALRLPIYLTTLIFLILFFFFLKKLFGITVALFSLIFIGLSPIILGISLIINPDSLLWGFLPLSILSYLIYQKSVLEKNNTHKKYLIFSGILLGLALLTKYVANIGYIYILGLIFLGYIYSAKKNLDFFQYLKKTLLDYILLIAISCLTFFLLYPACWHDPQVLLKGTLFSPAFKTTWPLFAGFFGLLVADMFFFKNKISARIMNFFAKYGTPLKMALGVVMFASIAYILANVFSGMKFYDFMGEMASPKGGSNYNLMDFIQLSLTDLYGLIFGLTPLVFIFFIWATFTNAFKKESASYESSIVFTFSLFIFLYYIASTANHVTATIRYQIAMFPFASIIAAIGLRQFLAEKPIKKFARIWAVHFLVIIISFISLYSISPYFFTYASGLLPKQYILNLKDMGDGSFEAAKILNSLPNAGSLVVWSDKGAVCETFVGTCKVSFSKKDTKDIPFDYFVASAGRKSRSLKMESSGYFDTNIEFSKLYSSDDSGTYKIIIGNRPDNFVKIYKTSDLLAQ